MKRLLKGLLCTFLCTGALAAEPFGRLFFTPAERAQLDIARSQKQRPAPMAAAQEPVEAPPVPQTVTYGGIVRRSDGKAMLWINNRLVDEKEALRGLNLRGRVRSDGAVTLQVPQTGKSINVKVGQSVEVLTGKVAEGRSGDAKDKEATDRNDPKSAGAPKAADGAHVGLPAPQAESAPDTRPHAADSVADLARRGERTQEQARGRADDAKEQRPSGPAGKISP